MKKKEKKFPKHQIRAAIVPSSINEEERTIEVVFGTENPVKRYHWGRGGFYNEILSFDPENVDMTRLESGSAQFLDNHSYYGSVRSSVLGVVLTSEIKNKKGYAKIKVSSRSKEMDEVWKDISDGITKNISVGYNVKTYEHTENEGGLDVYRAIDWEPMEISLVTIPADHSAQIRAGESTKEEAVQMINIISSLKNPKMDKNAKGQIRSLVSNAGLPESFAEGLIGRNVSASIAKAEIATELKRIAEAAPAPIKEPIVPVVRQEEGKVDVQKTATDAARAAVILERNRTSTINQLVKRAGLPDAYAIELVEGELDIEGARTAILNKWSDGETPIIRSANSRVTGPGEVEKKRSGMEDALMFRAGSLKDEEGNIATKLPEGAVEYRNMKLIDMAKDVLEAQGTSTRGKSAYEVAKLALVGDGRTMATGDFPIILGNTVNRTLRSAYNLAPRTFMPFCRRVTVSDFKTVTRTQLSGLMTGLDKIGEGGEYKRTKMTEAKEEWKIEKFGKIIPVTFEMLINDDLDAFSRIPTAMAAQAAQKQSDIVYSILTGNPVMDDGVALFHANHNNLAATATAINDAGLNAARKSFRNQKGLNKKDFLNLMATYLICGPDKEGEAEKLLMGVISPNTTANVNLFGGKYKLIVEPRITGNQWFMSALPTLVDTIEYGFLDGNEIYTEQRQGFDVDGMEVKLRMTFGAKAIDSKGLYKNAGA